MPRPSWPSAASFVERGGERLLDLMSLEVQTDSEGNRFELVPIDCPTCGPVPYDVLGYRGGKHHRYRLGITSCVVRCRGCDLLFPRPFPRPLDPQQLYGDPEKYFEHHDEQVRIDAQRAVVREIKARVGNNASILDIGSGRGELLQAARLEGIDDVVGLEFSEAMIAHAADKYGVVVHQESIEQHAETAQRTYDAFVLSAVLEHVYDPNSMIASVVRLSRPGTIVYIDIPVEPNLLTMVAAAMNKVTGSQTVLNLAPTFSPFHVFGFNKRALSLLLRKHGVVMESCRVWARPEIPAGSGLKDRVRSVVGTQVNRVANVTGTASNMYVWARVTGN